MTTKPVYKCPYCGLRMRYPETVIKHIDVAHPGQPVDIPLAPVTE